MKSKLILILMAILLTVGVLATVYYPYESPADNSYWILGGNYADNITFLVNVSGNSTHGPGNATLYTNVSGAWAESGHNSSNSSVGINYQYAIQNQTLAVTDDMVINWNFYVCTNLTDGGYETECVWAGSNRTMFVERAPVVTLLYPADGSASSETNPTITFNVTGDVGVFNCEVYSNRSTTLNWSVEKYLNNVQNSTSNTSNPNKTTTINFGADGDYLWNVKCNENGNTNIRSFASANRTIHVSSVSPIVTINSPTALSYTNDANISINLTVTGTQLTSCGLYINGSINRVNSSVLVSGTPFILNSSAEADGHYSVIVGCNNSLGTQINSTAMVAIMDTLIPNIESNATLVTDSCTSFDINVTSNEAVNTSIGYGFTTLDRTYSSEELDFSKEQHLEAIFDGSYETTIYFNITACDQAGNCNTTRPETILTSPAPLCSGWSIYSVHETSINLSDIYIETGVEYVYWYNNTDQTWLYYAPSATTSKAINVGTTDANIGVVHLYTSTNTTWFRSASIDNLHRYNISDGNMYLPLYNSTSFGNLSSVNFRNTTGGGNMSGVQFNITYFAGYNNTDQTWVNHIFEWSTNNATKLGNTKKTGIDSLWLYSAYNISINMSIPSASGWVYGNWSIIG